MEYTTQKLREEFQTEHNQLQQLQEDELVPNIENKSLDEAKHFRPIELHESKPINIETPSKNNDQIQIQILEETPPVDEKQDTKSKKKRRKKSVLKKKTQNPRKNSASSGSTQSDQNDVEPDAISLSNTNTISTSTDSTPPTSVDQNTSIESKIITQPETPSRIRDLDIHFFSDTEVQSGLSPRQSRPSTPVQSDTEFEVSQREKNDDSSIMSNSASWKWGELPTQPEEPIGQSKEEAKQAQRNSMLGGMFSFMKQGRKMRKNAPSDGLYLEDLQNEDIDPEVAALYFPQRSEKNSDTKHGGHEDDRESGNGTSVPQSPTSMEGGCIKSHDSDFDEGKHSDKCLDFVAISACGGLEKDVFPTDEEFQKHQIQFADVSNTFSHLFCFINPNLVFVININFVF